MAIEKILVLDDEPLIRKSLSLILQRRRAGVATAATLAEARRHLATDSFDMVFMDLRLPDGDGTDLLKELTAGREQPFIVMMTGYGSLESAVHCIRAGAFDYLVKPFSDGQIEVVVERAEEFQRLVSVNAYLQRPADDPGGMVGESPVMRDLLRLIERVAPTEVTVLIQGESGTGKEVVATEIHRRSARAKAPFIKVNCAAVAENLMESEFFGHEKGAFTGAVQRREGRFELAHGGTILLDEVSEISPALQAKLLRVLQEREFERVGGTKTIRVDVRVLATTNRDLSRAVQEGRFREDLFYRLNVFPVVCPPLRDRDADVIVLAGEFLHRAARRHGRELPGFTAEAVAALRAHGWPGNVRELQNVVERAAILAEPGNPVTAAMLGLEPTHPAGPVQEVVREVKEPLAPLAEMERRWILRALAEAGGKRGLAAEILELSPRTLRYKLAEYRAAGYLDDGDMSGDDDLNLAEDGDHAGRGKDASR